VKGLGLETPLSGTVDTLERLLDRKTRVMASAEALYDVPESRFFSKEIWRMFVELEFMETERITRQKLSREEREPIDKRKILEIRRLSIRD
jgi:hypothetical protein